ncbi:MAG TPA: hypothetical protein VEW65_16505 [Chryseolinea sp.]|nr:hypothetical protein [Chryseolinea sp.]
MNGYDDPEPMTQRNFEHISSEIERKSGISISGTTIRRLSRGEFNRLPQIATLNAIANYFDCKTWQEYKSSLKSMNADATDTVEVADAIPKIEDNDNYASKRTQRIKLSPKWMSLLIAPIIILGYYIYLKSHERKNFENASFSGHKTTGNDLPNTVVFRFDIDKVRADSFFIQQSWDKNRRVRIHKNHYTITDIYYEPGYHIAKLIADDSVIKTFDINIATDKWVFYANENKTAYGTEYINTKSFLKGGSLAITKEELLESGVDLSPEKMFLYSYFPSKHAISGDNFTLKTRVRMKEVTNNRCPYIAVEVYGQRFFMLIKSTGKGCANLASLWFGEKAINGQEADLSSVAYDVKEWADLELNVRNKHVTIKINDHEAFSTTYQRSLNMITGLSFISNGLCEVDHVSLVGSNGKTFYQNNFNQSSID